MTMTKPTLTSQVTMKHSARRSGHGVRPVHRDVQRDQVVGAVRRVESVNRAAPVAKEVAPEGVLALEAAQGMETLSHAAPGPGGR